MAFIRSRTSFFHYAYNHVAPYRQDPAHSAMKSGWIPQSVIFRYGIAAAFVGAALALSLLFQRSLPDGFLIFFLLAVMLAGWFGRTGAGLFAVVLSMPAVVYYFIAPHHAFAVELDELPYFLSFLLSAVVTSWLGSARRSAEERQKAHLDELFEQTPEAIMLVDVQDRVLRVNRRFSQIFGYTAEEALHRLSRDLIIPESLRAEVQKTREALAQGGDFSTETVRQRKDGSLLDVSEVSFPVLPAGKLIGFYVILRDITESKRAAERLQQAQAKLAHLSRITTMGELAASIAHEINQPIGAVVTNGNAALRWLSQHPPQVNDAEEAVECIVRDANRAAQVVSRIRSLLQKAPVSMVYLDINEVIREVLTLTSPETDRRRIVVKTALAGGLPPVAGDRIQLQQVLLNLMMNSLEAMSPVRDRLHQMLIESSVKDRCILVRVTDSGCGLDAQQADSIFDPFFTTKKDGIGMGLTISRSIVEAHGGRLWAEAGSPHGAILSFTLPVAGGAE